MAWRFEDHKLENMVGIYVHELSNLWSPYEWLNQLLVYKENKIRIWVVNFTFRWKYHSTGNHVHFGYASIPVGYDLLHVNDILPGGQNTWLKGRKTWYGGRGNDGHDLYKFMRHIDHLSVSREAVVYVDGTDPYVADLLKKLDIMRQIDAEAISQRLLLTHDERLQYLKQRLV